MRLNTGIVVSAVVLLAGWLMSAPSLWVPGATLVACIIDLFTRSWVVSDRLGSSVTLSVILKFILSLIGFLGMIGQFVSAGMLVWWLFK